MQWARWNRKALKCVGRRQKRSEGWDVGRTHWPLLALEGEEGTRTGLLEAGKGGKKKKDSVLELPEGTLLPTVFLA